MKRIACHKLVQFLTVAIAFMFLSYVYVFLFQHQGKILLGYDRPFHLERFEEMYNALRNGYVIPYISTYDSARVGIATNIFYPWGNVLFYALIRKLVVSPVNAYYLFIGLGQFIGLILAYVAGKQIFENRRKAYLFALLYRFSIYVMVDDFTFADFGAAGALVFLPLVLSGFWLVMRSRQSWSIKGNLVLVLGLVGETYCHVLSTFLTVLALILGYLWLLFVRKATWQHFKNLAVSAVLYLISTMGIWVPMITIMWKENIYTPGYETILKNDYQLSFLITNSLDNHLAREYPNIGLVLILVAIFGGLGYSKASKELRWSYLMGTMVMLVSTSLFPWQFIGRTPIGVIQYSFRLLIFVMLFLSLYGAEIIDNNLGQYSLCKIILISMAIIGVTLSSQQRYIHYDNGNLDSNLVIKGGDHGTNWGRLINNQSYVGALTKQNVKTDWYADYLPKVSLKVKDQLFKHELNVNGKKIFLKNDQLKSGFQTLNYKVNIPVKKGNKIIVPMISYDRSMYSVSIQGERVPFKQTKNDLIEVKVPKDIHSLNIEVKFITPLLWRVVLLTSFLSIFGMLGILIFFSIRNLKQSQIKNFEEIRNVENY